MLFCSLLPPDGGSGGHKQQLHCDCRDACAGAGVAADTSVHDVSTGHIIHVQGTHVLSAGCVLSCESAMLKDRGLWFLVGIAPDVRCAAGTGVHREDRTWTKEQNL